MPFCNGSVAAVTVASNTTDNNTADNTTVAATPPGTCYLENTIPAGLSTNVTNLNVTEGQTVKIRYAFLPKIPITEPDTCRCQYQEFKNPPN